MTIFVLIIFLIIFLTALITSLITYIYLSKKIEELEHNLFPFKQKIICEECKQESTEEDEL